MRLIYLHPSHPSSPLPPPPNLPKPPISLLKNFPIFLRFSFRFPAACSVAESGLCALRPCGGGLVILDSAGVPPRAGVPKRSTPSLAAVMMALPKVDGSKRAGRLDVLRLAAEEREGRPVGMCTPPVVPLVPPTTSGVRRAEDCCTSVFLGDERWAWNRSTKLGWSCLRMPFNSRIFRKLASDLSAMWIR